ncbi:uncharacterized protein GGS22DRAFT_107370 [Annulohypoxylon maeteangense]|uniref:uncharacterized protein n=1 Tax=Annulohypoxylon maeteangense TaxID=1927788 RepID=UPI002007249A|nr:uncharacterized protein GGS22DRAFT_107370 [Annulohypoxylon maeteangense]KAI0887293.1 hypothetical protein GGS22DRAFT_107370 [Annulohypoxylon maeteangense]
MHFNHGSPLNSPQRLSDSQKWDPDIVLGDIDGGCCIGFAKTRGRRCQRYIAHHKTSYGYGILNRLARGSPSEAAESPELHDAAEIMLCWQHDSQISDILRRWKRKLESWADDIESKDKSRVKTEESEDLLRELLRGIAVLDQNYKDPRHRSRQNIKREEDERLAEEKKRRDQEKARQRKEEEKARQRKEEEAKQKKKEEEEKARIAAFRVRVRLAKEWREQEARKKAEKEAELWRTAWERYSNAWSKPANVSVTNIPWPVKSGLQSDVNEANVKLFFAKAPPAALVDSGDKRFKLINKENLRWHTDKVMQRFGSDVVKGDAKAPLGVVAKVVIELRQEARNRR